jgi:hypothetical protein
MGIRSGAVAVSAAIAFFASVSYAVADGPVGTDPSSNFVVGSLPFACQTDPTGAVCIDAALNDLDQARASLGQPPYALPGNFVSLDPAKQALVLTNLDRILYGLAPVQGLTGALDQDAATGVQGDADPQPSDSDWLAFTSNWAGGYENIVLAYEAWMYDDGPGSGNMDCSASGSSGCWGHRHDILWQFDSGGGALLMGAAAGVDPSGSLGEAMLIEQITPQSNPSYTYTWAQAVADGADGSIASAAGSGQGGSSPAGPGSRGSAGAHTASVSIRIKSVRSRGHRVTFTVLAPRGSSLRCSLTGRTSGGRRVRRAKRCGVRAAFIHLHAGRYWLRVTSRAGSVTRLVTIR